MTHRPEKQIEEIVASFVNDPNSDVNSALVNRLEYVESDFNDNVTVYSGPDGVWQASLSLTVANMAIADYLIMYGYGWNTSNAGASFQARVRADFEPNADNWFFQKFGPPPAAGGTGVGRYSVTGTNKLYGEYGAKKISIGSAGVHVFELDFTRSGGAGTPLASMWDRFIILFKYPQVV